ncbi:MAG: ECF transporter S component [Firmicutes bacterium]|nr:ECF transporter S component [Clostridiales bacterium]MBQ4340502.1 ECF transporter S component [Bacillota bacterium]
MRESKVKVLTYSALMMGLAIVATMMIRIPVPATQGYVHLGDTVLILSVLILGKKKGALAGALGQAAADILGGYAIFAPATFVAKILMGLLIGVAVEKMFEYGTGKNRKLVPAAIFMIVLSCVSMAGTYYLFECAMYGSFVVPLVEIPANIIQFSVSAVLAAAVGGLLVKTPARAWLYIGKQVK